MCLLAHLVVVSVLLRKPVGDQRSSRRRRWPRPSQKTLPELPKVLFGFVNPFLGFTKFSTRQRPELEYPASTLHLSTARSSSPQLEAQHPRWPANDARQGSGHCQSGTRIQLTCIHSTAEVMEAPHDQERPGRPGQSVCQRCPRPAIWDILNLSAQGDENPSGDAMNTQEAIDQQLRSGERCELVLVASRTVELTVSSGRLCLTNQRLLFVPKEFNVRGRAPWSIDRSEILGIDIAKRNWQPYNGGMRRRLIFRFVDRSE